MSWILIISISEVIPCSAQKSSISWVSRMPPITEPASRRRPKMQIERSDGSGFFRRAHQRHSAV